MDSSLFCSLAILDAAMKKIFFAFALLLVIVLVGLYVLIPTKLKISAIGYVRCTDNAANRLLAEPSQWKLWWPDSVSQPGGPASKASMGSTMSDSGFSYNGTVFSVKQKSFSGVILSTNFWGSEIQGEFAHAASSNDSIAVIIQFKTTLSLKPISRIQQYLEAQKLKKNCVAILDHLKKFLENKENVYGISIKEIRVTDTLLASRFFLSATYPSVDKIYEAVDALKTYIAANGGSETGFPMLNVTMVDSSHYKTRVAIPINKEIKESEAMQLKKMIPGRILVTEIKGGQQTINNAYTQLRYFLSDNEFASPAIPFESMITNRVQEKDSSKWITRIYYPIL